MSAIGDIIFAATILPYLKQAYPDSHISWLTKPGMKLVASGFSQITRAVDSLHQIRNEVFDIAIDMQGLLKTALLLLRVKAKRKIGLGSKEGSSLLVDELVPRDQSYLTEDSTIFAHEYVYLGKYLSQHHRTLPYPSYQSLENSFSSQKYVAICPFTTRDQKHWLWPHWQSLIDKINTQLHLPCYILGSATDTVPLNINGDNKNLCGRGDIEWSFSVLQHADAVVSVDTGLGHYAVLHHKPVVLLFGSTIPYQHSLNPNMSILYQALPCSPCGRRPICGGEFNCMRMLTPDDVFQRLQTAISRG